MAESTDTVLLLPELPEAECTDSVLLLPERPEAAALLEAEDSVLLLPERPEALVLPVDKDTESVLRPELPAQPPARRELVLQRAKRAPRAAVLRLGPRDPSEPPPFFCAACGRTLGSAAAYSQHQRNVHSSLRPYVCGDCGLSFKRRAARRQHVRSQHWPCAGCADGSATAAFRAERLCYACGCARYGRPAFPCAGVSRVGCQWLDAMQAALGRPIQHSHYDAASRTLRRDEYRPPCLPRSPVDGFDAPSHTVYEFLGDEFHGHPRLGARKARNMHGLPYRLLFEKTEAKLRTLAAQGYRVLYLWESDYRAARPPREFAHSLEWHT